MGGEVGGACIPDFEITQICTYTHTSGGGRDSKENSSNIQQTKEHTYILKHTQGWECGWGHVFQLYNSRQTYST